MYASMEPKQKYRAKLSLTNEFLQKLLALPDDVSIQHISYNDKKETVELILTGNEINDMNQSFLCIVNEGQEVPEIMTKTYDISELEYAIYERVRNKLIGAIPDDPEGEQ